MSHPIAVNKCTEMKIMLDEGAKMPTRAHADDAGLDLYSREDTVIPADGTYVFDTGVHVQLPMVVGELCGNTTMEFITVGFVKSKSGLFVKHDIITDGTVDYGYTGSIKVKLCNLGKTDYKIRNGDKIAQLCIEPVLTPSLKVVTEFKSTARGDNGFGSTGR